MRLIEKLIFILFPGCLFSQIDFSSIPAPKAKIPKLNIVMILADDIGYGDFDRFPTPALDSLKAKGIFLKNFYVEPSCTPTRTAILTGDYPGLHGTGADADGMELNTTYPDQTRRVELSEITIGEVAKQAGYNTGIFGKWHIGRPVTTHGPIYQGFDEWKGFQSNVDHQSHVHIDGDYLWFQSDTVWRDTGYIAHLIQEYSEDFIFRNRDTNFLCFAHHFSAHFPVQGPDDTANREEGGGPYSYRSNSSPVDTAYKNMIQDLDNLLGRTYFYLDSLGLLDRTIIIYLSDNGGDIDDSWQSDSNGPHKGGKRSVYEGGIRSQALVIWEGGFSPREVDERIHCMDLFPFIMDAMRMNKSEYVYSGESFFGLLLNDLLGKSDSFVRISNTTKKTVIGRNYKIYDDGAQQVFMLNSDTTFNENSDVKSIYTQEYKQLQRELVNWKTATGL